MSVTAGYFRQLGRFYLYAGAGYGTRTLAYELSAPLTLNGVEYAEGTQVKDTVNSAVGVAGEVGRHRPLRGASASPWATTQ